MHRVLSEVEAEATVRAAWDAGLRYFDTAPLYGHGLSESADRPRAGRRGARRLPGLHQGRPRCWSPARRARRRRASISDTPPLKVRFDYTCDGVLRSFEASLAAARAGPRRHPLRPRPRAADARLGAGLRSALARADRRRRLAGAGRAARGGAVAAIGLGVNEAAPASGCWPSSIRTCSCSPAATPCWSRRRCTAVAGVRAARAWASSIGGPFNSGVLAPRTAAPSTTPPRRPRCWRSVERLRGVCAPLRRAAGGRRAAVRRRPSGRGQRDPRRADGAGGRGERRR